MRSCKFKINYRELTFFICVLLVVILTAGYAIWLATKPSSTSDDNYDEKSKEFKIFCRNIEEKVKQSTDKLKVTTSNLFNLLYSQVVKCWVDINYHRWTYPCSNPDFLNCAKENNSRYQYIDKYSFELSLWFIHDKMNVFLGKVDLTFNKWQQMLIMLDVSSNIIINSCTTENCVISETNNIPNDMSILDDDVKFIENQYSLMRDNLDCSIFSHVTDKYNKIISDLKMCCYKDNKN